MGTKIFCLGESVLDLFFESQERVRAEVGGSVVNAALSLSAYPQRTYNVELLSEWGRDAAGNLIEEKLKKNKIGTDYCYRFNDGSTALVQVSLINGQPSYFFNKNYPQNRFSLPQINLEKTDFLLFGSWASIDSHLQNTYERLLAQADEMGAHLYYDPNLRPSYRQKCIDLNANVIKNIERASIFKMSNEDVEILTSKVDLTLQLDFLSSFGKWAILTQGSKSIWVVDPLGTRTEFSVNFVDIVSAVGAGDNFNAGFIAGCVEQNIDLNHLPAIDSRVALAVEKAIYWAQKVCVKSENSLSECDFL